MIRALLQKADLPGQWAAERLEVDRRRRVMEEAGTDVSRVLVELRTAQAQVAELARAARTGAQAARDVCADATRLAASASAEPTPLRADVRRVHVRDLAFDVFLDPDAGDPLTRELSRGYTFNDHLIGLMLDLIEPGDIVLDLGAHVGVFTLAAAAAGARVIAVEASARNAGLLRGAACRNGFGHVVVVQAAVSDRAGTVWFVNQGPFGQVVEDGEAGAVEVPAVTVADLVRELGWGPVAFVKMDVEGSEAAVLRGMAGLLSAADAPPLLYESNGHTLAAVGDSPRRLMAQVEALGYSSYLVEPNRLVGTRSGDGQAETSVDYLAVKRLPPTLAAAGWRVEPEMSGAERVRRLVAECGHPHPAHRRYALGAVAAAGPALRADAEVGAVLRALAAQDDDPEVRALAGNLLGPDPARLEVPA